MPDTDCPRIQENNQDIKGQKDESVKIIVEVELNPGLACGFHATFKDGVFDGVGIVGDNFEKSEDNGDDDHCKSEKNGDNEKQTNVTVVR